MHALQHFSTSEDTQMINYKCHNIEHGMAAHCASRKEMTQVHHDICSLWHASMNECFQRHDSLSRIQHCGGVK
jgi:hypothetical protein